MAPFRGLTMPTVALLLLALALAGCSGGPAREGGPVAEQVQLTLQVEGMTCGSCEAAITTKLTAMEGIEVLSATHTSGTVVVRHDPSRATPEAIAATIDGLGYRTTGWSPPTP